MPLVCSHSNAFISIIAKNVQKYILNLLAFEVVFSFIPNNFLSKHYSIEED